MLRRIAFGCITLGLVACAEEVVGKGGGASSSNDGGATTSSGGNDYLNTSTTPGAHGPVPKITSVSPLAGDYGTEVTIIGENLENAALNLAGDPATVSYANPNGTSGAQPTGLDPEDVIVSWSNTEIKFKYPFPADGAIRVASPGGTAEGGTFVPTWTPGQGVSGAFIRLNLLGAVSPSAGVTVAAFDDGKAPMIVVTGPNGTESRAFDRGATQLSAMSLYLTAAGKVDGFFVRDDHLWKLTDAAGAATTANTGVGAAMAAGGEDSTGPYAWIKSGANLTRLRAPTWTVDKTVTDPTPGTAYATSIAVGPDNGLFVGWAVTDGGSFPFYDQTAHPVGQLLRAGLSTFDPQVRVGGGVDDVMIWTRFFPGPAQRVVSYYCASDTGIFETSGIDCGGGWANVTTPSDTGALTSYDVGFDATTSFVAACNGDTKVLQLGPETNTAAQVPTVFPCPEVVAITVDPTHSGAMLTRVGDYLYAPRKR